MMTTLIGRCPLVPPFAFPMAAVFMVAVVPCFVV